MTVGRVGHLWSDLFDTVAEIVVPSVVTTAVHAPTPTNAPSAKAAAGAWSPNIE